MVDITGQRFGRLLVLSFFGNVKGNTKFLCKCDCGNIKPLSGASVREGKTISCGCAKVARMRALGTSPEATERGRRMGQANIGRVPFNKIIIPCRHCGKDFHGYDQTVFCSQVCANAWRSQHYIPKRRKADCLHCSKEFHPNGSGNRRFCSRTCWIAWKREDPGEREPLWRGGRKSYYGPTWKPQSRLARERDGQTCQRCGLHQAKPALDVHHILPWRMFDSFEDANRLANLTTLCKTCHRATEADFLRSSKVSA